MKDDAKVKAAAAADEAAAAADEAEAAPEPEAADAAPEPDEADQNIENPMPGTEDPPEGSVFVTVVEAMCDPVPLYVHGVGSFSLRVGQRQAVPVEAVEALRNSDCKIEEG